MRKGNYFNKTELELFSKQNPVFCKEQMKIINRTTPKSEIEIKTDKGGFKYKSVKAAYIKALVMLVSGGNFDFEIKSREYIAITKETLVEGRLTMFTGSNSVSRDQFGQHHLNIKSTTNERFKEKDLIILKQDTKIEKQDEKIEKLEDLIYKMQEEFRQSINEIKIDNDNID